MDDTSDGDRWGLWGEMVPGDIPIVGDSTSIVALRVCIPGQPDDGMWLVEHGPDAGSAGRAMIRTMVEWDEYHPYQVVYIRVKGGCIMGWDSSEPGCVSRPATQPGWHIRDGAGLVSRLERVPGVPAGLLVARRQPPGD